MGNCKLRQFNSQGSITDFSCDYIRDNQYTMKSDFRNKNRTDEILKSGGRDRAYEQYCNSLDNFLEKCKCGTEITLKCPKCLDEDHEGNFCRCESRNIALAKYLRAKGQQGGTSFKTKEDRERLSEWTPKGEAIV